MKFPHFSLLLITLLLGLSCKTSQKVQQKGGEVPDSSTKSEYRASYKKDFQLIHHTVRVTPLWDSKTIQGSSVLTLKPYFYPQRQLVLDAKEMDIHSLNLIDSKMELKPLPFTYDRMQIFIELDTIYGRADTLQLEIEYTSHPEKIAASGGSAIREDKGVYFINADGKNPFRPRQLWTQGETEASSVWFPTIEDPGQRLSQELYITVDTSFQTLSNGLLLSSMINSSTGTRTDYWKQSHALAPYLSMMAVGNWRVTKDEWRNMEVSYYVDPPYEQFARSIFPNTVEMLEYFSNLLRTDYPWEKFSQIAVHDFISGAMENNTAVVQRAEMQMDPRELLDEDYEDYVSHELFHHWFGNLVTCESWANITLNEGFATYGEYLWREYKYGRDDADRSNQDNLFAYVYLTKEEDPPLARHHYNTRDEVYDVVSYQKGGLVLHMLRKYVGDEAFFRSLELYLQRHAHSTAEIPNLRLIFEEVTGEDLNWFFDQWFYKAGKPSLKISQQWNASTSEFILTMEQIQNRTSNPVYRLPMLIDFYLSERKDRHEIVMDSVKQIFRFKFDEKPLLVNVDAERCLLLETRIENKSAEEYLYQYKNAPLYMDRFEAVNEIGKSYKATDKAAEVIALALDDKYWKIRRTALRYSDTMLKNTPGRIQDRLFEIAVSDPVSAIRKLALEKVTKHFPYSSWSGNFSAYLADSSYEVQAFAFRKLYENDTALARTWSSRLESDSGSAVQLELLRFYSLHPIPGKADFFETALRRIKEHEKKDAAIHSITYFKNYERELYGRCVDMLKLQGLYSGSNFINGFISGQLVVLAEGLKKDEKILAKKIIKTSAGSEYGIKLRAEKELINSRLEKLESAIRELENKINEQDKGY
ncbi:MAG: hypothetical protein DWQ44_06140 [Bacteroidetes bacterium]|nr:MAG: hypothetical protein DWQ33_13070 [Bacteroidota bacterium]REK03407.1 MAG: hypothetical protein DWQ39_09380 [Bacteroidota bacterium]REK34481.1 MAG: hypothetical protein DWQ44_06140 [Bacteroidota bacterium]